MQLAMKNAGSYVKFNSNAWVYRVAPAGDSWVKVTRSTAETFAAPRRLSELGWSTHGLKRYGTVVAVHDRQYVVRSPGGDHALVEAKKLELCVRQPPDAPPWEV